MGGILGTVAVVRRYPVKGLLGQDVDASDVTTSGLAGDRGLALVDAETGKVASPKNPRVWRGMLALSAAIEPGGVRVILPDGESVRADDPGVDEALSRALGRKVTLTATPPERAALDRAVPEEVLSEGLTARVAVEETVLGAGAPPGTFFDYAPLHLVTTSAIEAVGVEAVRYRPNLVIRTAGEGYVENGWAGAEVAVGDEVVLRVTVPTPRCAVPTLEHGSLPRDTSALRMPAAHNMVEPMPGFGPRPCVGVYAEVLRPGRVTTGDTVRLVH
ncbi:MOSC domain-containing protein [Nonomuraea africana]|uniref:Uncharacterized protein YcbX n=1 Tax=Nonomuraea africana TaxID=46171 RepID=A0ABR9KVN8_9ACTN|nr:MOSC N-terminal beta barrel domain-containing protein [Nonomuraea africana]MBE1565587.1 uncharacterized protein YcbX [Nonomuraea africana]